MNTCLIIELVICAAGFLCAIIGGIKDKWFSPQLNEISRNLKIIDRNLKVAGINIAMIVINVVWVLCHL